MTTTVTGLLCWRDFHPQEWQLASLHWSGRALQLDFAAMAESGLASMYPAFDWSVVLLAIMDISARAISLAARPQRAIRVTSVRKAPGRPNLHLVSSSRRPRQVRCSIWLRHRGLLILRGPCCRRRGIGIRQIGSLPHPSSAPRKPGHEPERSRRYGPACWPVRSPARCDAAASWPPRSRA